MTTISSLAPVAPRLTTTAETRVAPETSTTPCGPISISPAGPAGLAAPAGATFRTTILPSSQQIAEALDFVAGKDVAVPPTAVVRELEKAGLFETVDAAAIAGLKKKLAAANADVDALASARNDLATAQKNADDASGMLASKNSLISAGRRIGAAMAKLEAVRARVGDNPESSRNAAQAALGSWTPYGFGGVKLTTTGSELYGWSQSGVATETLRTTVAKLGTADAAIATLETAQGQIYDGVHNCGDVESAAYAAAGFDAAIGETHIATFAIHHAAYEAATILGLQVKRGERDIPTATADFADVYDNTSNAGDVASAILMRLSPRQVAKDTFARIYHDTSSCGDSASALLTAIVMADHADEKTVEAVYRDIYDNTHGCGQIASAVLVRQAVLFHTPIAELRDAYTKAYSLLGDDVAAAVAVATALRTNTDLGAIAVTARRIRLETANCNTTAATLLAAKAFGSPDMVQLTEAALADKKVSRERREKSHG